jgi:hypothetical protein
MATSRFNVTFDQRPVDACEDEVAAVVATLQAFLARADQTEQGRQNLWALAGRRESQGLEADRDAILSHPDGRGDRPVWRSAWRPSGRLSRTA